MRGKVRLSLVVPKSVSSLVDQACAEVVIARMGEREGEKSGNERRRRAKGQPGGAEGPWTRDESGEERRSERGG